ncbi:MAG: flagellar assembly protein FliW [Clostridiales bacterium]|jgi:flagellar assembly factor FliW|nr:flagellar assembly protein FliW [Clostridiales bacterium]MDR2751184.1 flagellar assembly protein FliW [Clostridiales bacterium]
MKLKTKHFGEIEYDPSLAITFDEGLPGFPECKQFIVLLENKEEDTFSWLQSTDDGDLAFALINIYNVMPEYNPLVRNEEVAGLGDMSDNNLLVYNVVVIPDDIKQMRANLRAPIVINPTTKKGKQVILDNDEYELKYRIFDHVETKPEAVGSR